MILENDDVKDQIRLKEFANVNYKKDYLETNGFERIDRRPIVHWLLEHHCQPAILCIASDDEILHINGLIEEGEYTVGDILQLERVGFARITNINEEGPIDLIYLHD